MDENGSQDRPPQTGGVDAIIRRAGLEKDAEGACALAREALARDESRPEAYTILASWERDAARAESLYRRAMGLALRKLGEDAFARDAGPFGEDPAARRWARAYSEALAGLVSRLAEQGGRGTEVIEEAREALRLDPDDPWCVRDDLVGTLLEAGEHDEALALLSRFDEKNRGSAAYARALVSFARRGDAEEARSHLAAALATAPGSEAYLLGERPIPEFTREYLLTDESDAAIYASRVKGAFDATPGATEWLARWSEPFNAAAIIWTDPAPDSPTVARARAAVREMVREMAQEVGAQTRVLAGPDGTASLIVEARLPTIRNLALRIIYAGFSGFQIEVAREEMIAAVENIQPVGFSVSVPGSVVSYAF